MKKWLFLLSGILEIIGSFIVYFKPNSIFELLTINSIESKLYGITMFCFGILGLLCFKHYKDSDFLRHLYVLHLFFHAVITTMTYSTPEAAFSFARSASLTHGALFLLFLIGYLKDIKPDKV